MVNVSLISPSIKVDLIIWTKNGAGTLDAVLKRINQVIPNEVVNNKFIVDDCSTDKTRYLAWSNGWSVRLNEGHGISDGANTALKYVETDYFCSFEQDVLLSPYWWNRVSRLILGKSKVAAASGLRFLPKNNLCFSIDPYQLTRQGVEDLSGYGKTLDNTIWHTNTLRNLGGFPKMKYAGIDTCLHELFKAEGFGWLVDFNVQSLHLHKGFVNELRHTYFYGLSLPELHSHDWQGLLLKFLKSPISSMKMCLRMRDARLLFAYPYIRLVWLLGYLKGDYP